MIATIIFIQKFSYTIILFVLHIKGGGKIHTDFGQCGFALLAPLQARCIDKILTMDVVGMRTPHRHRTSAEFSCRPSGRFAWAASLRAR